MRYFNTPLTKDMVAKAGYIYLAKDNLYYREGSMLNLRLFPATPPGVPTDSWAMMIHIAGQEPFGLCEVHGLSHLLTLIVTIEGDGNPVIFDLTKL